MTKGRGFYGYFAPAFTLALALFAAPEAYAAASIQPAGGGGGAVIKKAAAVEEIKQDGVETAAGMNLLGTAVGLVSGFQALKKTEQALEQGCMPSSAEVTWTNKMIQEFAKTGRMTAEKMFEASPAKEGSECGTADSYVRTASMGTAVCYQAQKSSGGTAGANAGERPIWDGYPMAESGMACPPDKTCNADKDKKGYTNVYDLLAIMDWKEADLINSEEASTWAKLTERMERCSPASIKRAKQEAVGGFITTAIGGIGQKQGTGDVMPMVNTLLNQSGNNAVNALGSVGTTILPQMLMK